jgi:hypothetical protein
MIVSCRDRAEQVCCRQTRDFPRASRALIPSNAAVGARHGVNLAMQKEQHYASQFTPSALNPKKSW